MKDNWVLYVDQDALERPLPRGYPQASATRILETSKINEFATCLASPHLSDVIGGRVIAFIAACYNVAAYLRDVTVSRRLSGGGGVFKSPCCHLWAKV